MSIKLRTATLLFSMLVSTPLLAQVQAPASDTTQPPAVNAAPSAEVQNTASSVQWRSSKLIGLNVYNDNNEKIGDIADMLVDQSGKIQAVIIGVGGFLGMGERWVAVNFDQLKWVDTPVSSRTSSTNVTPATTGSASSANSSNKMYPDHALLNATKDQLKAMPEFKYPK